MDGLSGTQTWTGATQWCLDLEWCSGGVVWGEKMVYELRGEGEGCGKGYSSNFQRFGSANINSHPRVTCRGPFQQPRHDSHGRFRSHHYRSRTAPDLTAASCAMEPPTPTSPLYKNGTSSSCFYYPTSLVPIPILDLPPKTATRGFNFAKKQREVLSLLCDDAVSLA